MLTICLCIFFASCRGQVNNEKTIDNYKSEILPEKEMRETTDKAVKLIQAKNYLAFKDLFAPEIAKGISDQQINSLVDKIDELFIARGVPTGDENILPALNATMNGSDTVFINNIMYNFKQLPNETSSLVLTFSFLKKYGTGYLVGVHANSNPLSAGTTKPTITQLTKFELNTNEINRFRIYYSEGKNKKTKYKNELGFFAVEGDKSSLETMGIEPTIKAIFSDLKKYKIETVEPFNSALRYDDDTKFISAEFGFDNKPYSVFIYLPIEDGGIYSGKIILMQREYANLGYKFVLDQRDYQEIVKLFPKVASMNLDKYYVDKP